MAEHPDAIRDTEEPESRRPAEADAGQYRTSTGHPPPVAAQSESAPPDEAETRAALLAPFVHQHTVLLTTYRRNGTPVGTPVNIAIEGGHGVVRTWDTAGKMKRLRHTSDVEIAASTRRGRPTGPPIRAHARILTGDESIRAGQVLARKHPIIHGVAVPLIHRLRGNTTSHIELIPVVDDETTSHRDRSAETTQASG